MSKLDTTNISELFSSAVNEFNTKLETIKKTNFDNSDFVDEKMKEIKIAKKSIEEKNNNKDSVLDRQSQALRTELDKELSGSNEVIYRANTEFDKNVKAYKNKLEEENIKYNSLVSEIETQKSEQTTAINLHSEERIAGFSPQKESINNEYNNGRDAQLLTFDKIKQSSQERIKNLHQQYFSEVDNANNELNNLLNRIVNKRPEADKIKNDIVKLEREFEKIKISYENKIAKANKSDLGGLKKEFAAKNKEFNNNKAKLSEEINSFHSQLDNEIKQLQKAYTEKKNTLAKNLLLDLVECDYNLHNAEHLLNLENNKLMLANQADIKKIDEQINLENNLLKLNLSTLDYDFKNKILNLNKDYHTNLAQIESEQQKIELDYNRIKTEQNCLRNSCKAKLELNLNISKVRTQFELKNAEIDEIKTIQNSKSEINISNINLDYNRIKENYFITDSFFSIAERAIVLQNTNKSVNFSSPNKVEAILKSKVSSFHTYIDSLIEYNKTEYLNIINALKDTHDLERKQLESVLSLVKKTANNNIIEYTTNNINELSNLYREQVEAITNNYLAIEKHYTQYKNEISEGMEKELANFNSLASSLNNSINELNNQIHEGVVKQTNVYNNYLNNFDKYLNNNINDINLMNTQELSLYTSSVEENNKLLNNQIAELQKKLEEVLKQFDQEKKVAIDEIDRKLRASDEELQAKIRNIIKSIELEIASNQQQIESNKISEQKLRLAYSKNIKTIDDNLNNNLKIATNEYNNNLEKSLKLKVKTIKVKKHDYQVGKEEDNWWHINEA